MVAWLVLLAGCGSKSEAEQQQAASELASALGAALDHAAAAGGSAAAGDVDLPRLGLRLAAPAGTTVSDALLGTGHSVMRPGLVVAVTTADESSPTDLAAATEGASIFSPTNVREEPLADGFALAFENRGEMGANYFVTVRRTTGDKTVMCETTAMRADQQAAALSACKSLHL